MRLSSIAVGILLLGSALAAEPPSFERMNFNNPGLEVDLSLGIWPHASVYDSDGDGRLDLFLRASGAPMEGSKRTPLCRVYRDFMGSVPSGEDVPRTMWDAPAKNDGRPHPRLVRWDEVPHPRKGENRARYRVDLDGDGLEDCVVAVSDWHNYGKVGPKCTSVAYDANGVWTNSIIETYVYFFKTLSGTGADTKFAPPRLLTCEGRATKFLEGPYGGCKMMFDDFDGDGDTDILTSEFVDSFWYFENVGGKGEVKLAPGRRVVAPDGHPVSVDLCMYEPCWVDLNGDGKADIVAAEEDGRVCWFENAGRTDGNRTPVFIPHGHFRQKAQELKFGCLATPFGIDWDGDGDWDFIAGNSAGYLSFIENLSGPSIERPKWAEPKLLTVAGRPIRTIAGPTGSPQGPAERKWGYSSVSCGDWDGDGVLDVIANDINGDVLFYRGKKRGGTDLAAAKGVEVEWNGGVQPQARWEWRRNPGKVLRAPWRTTAEMVDFNGDGLLDLAVIDHEGYLCVFERFRDKAGALRLKHPVRAFVDEKGRPIRLTSGKAGASGRVRFRLADWTGDGEFDILEARWNAVLWEQVGRSGSKRVFKCRDWIGKDQLQGHTCCPTVVDFDGNGVLDGVVAAEDGYFYYVRNPGRVQPKRVKILASGWDVRAAKPKDLLDHAADFDKSGFDGVFLMLEDTRKLLTSPAWNADKFDHHLDTIRAFAAHRGLRETLLQCQFTPEKRISWFDRAAWARFAHNAGVLAAFAKRAGLKGLSDDNEDYPHSNQWFYDPEKDVVTYNEVCLMARQYGEQVGKAMFDAYPDMVFMSMWHLSGDHAYFKSPDPAGKMRDAGDLWPAFVEGLVRACPPTGRLVDGNESGYSADAESNDYYVQSWNIKQAALGLLTPENRAKYLAALSVSFGIYTDMCVNTNAASCWYFPPGADGTRISRFTANIAQAARVAEDYLWVYGEKGLVVPWMRDTKRFRSYKTWEELLPGFTAAIRAQTDPEGLAAEALSVSSANLLPKKPLTWQHPKRVQGRFETKDGVWTATGVESGCYILETPAVAGHLYAVGGEVRGNGTVAITWKRNGKLMGQTPGGVLEMATQLGGGWRRGVGSFCVPNGADRLVIHLGLARQRADETTAFRNVKAVEIY